MEIIALILIIVSIMGIFRTDIKNIFKSKKCNLKEQINQKVMETINITDSRPLIEKGLIIVHKIGVRGMSPARTEEEICRHREDFSEHLLEQPCILHHVKFYKEYWLPDYDSNTITVQINII